MTVQQHTLTVQPHNLTVKPHTLTVNNTAQRSPKALGRSIHDITSGTKNVSEIGLQSLLHDGHHTNFVPCEHPTGTRETSLACCLPPDSWQGASRCDTAQTTTKSQQLCDGSLSRQNTDHDNAYFTTSPHPTTGISLTLVETHSLLNADAN